MLIKITVYNKFATIVLNNIIEYLKNDHINKLEYQQYYEYIILVFFKL